MVTLDTCAIIWRALLPKELSKKAKAAIDSNELIVSDISFWEIAMFIKTGRIRIGIDCAEFIKLFLESYTVTIKSISQSIADVAVNFDDSINKDPADRIISATSIVEHAPLITKDTNLRKSKIVQTIW